MIDPWDGLEKEILAQPSVPPITEEKKTKKQFFLSQSLIKKLIDKNHEEIELCPMQLYYNHVAPGNLRIKQFVTRPMMDGSYGETLILGSGAKGEVTEGLPLLENGKKSKDQIRIESQAFEFWPRHAMRNNIMVVKGFNTQIPIYRRWSDSIVIRGELDLFPTVMMWEGKPTLACIDLKYTADINTERGNYPWGKPEWIDHLQADIYSWMLGEIDIELCKEMDPAFEIKIGFNEVFTQSTLTMLHNKNFSFIYTILGYKKDDLKNQFKMVERKFWNADDMELRKRDLVERIRKSIARLNYLKENKWKPEPKYERCKNCSVSKLVGGPCSYYIENQSI